MKADDAKAARDAWPLPLEGIPAFWNVILCWKNGAIAIATTTKAPAREMNGLLDRLVSTPGSIVQQRSAAVEWRHCKISTITNVPEANVKKKMQASKWSSASHVKFDDILQRSIAFLQPGPRQLANAIRHIYHKTYAE